MCPKRIVSGLNRFYRGHFQNTPHIKTFFGYASGWSFCLSSIQYIFQQSLFTLKGNSSKKLLFTVTPLIHTPRFHSLLMLVFEGENHSNETLGLFKGIGTWAVNLSFVRYNIAKLRPQRITGKSSDTDLFPMSSCIATRRLVYNGGYIQKPLSFLNSFETSWSGRLYMVTKVLRTSSWTYHIYATIHCSNFGNPLLWTSLWRFGNGSIS